MTRVRGLYAVIRYIPNLLRGEFVNVGVVLVCPELSFQDVRVLPNFDKGSKTNKLLEGSDGHFIRYAMHKLKEGFADKRIEDWVGAEGVLEGILTEEGLKGLTLSYQNNIQLTPPRAVAVEQPEVTLEKLFMDFVGVMPIKEHSSRVTVRQIRKEVKEVFEQEGLFALGLEQDLELPLPTGPVVDLAYKNGVWNCFQAMSFAVTDRDVIRDVNAYRQTLRDARESDSDMKDAHFIVLGHTPESASARVRELVEALRRDQIEVFPYQDAKELVPKIREDLKEHARQHALMN